MNSASKTNVIILIISLFALQCASETFQMVWSDEFDGSSLDSTKWQKEVNCDGGGNNELQCYTSSDSNLKVEGGFLKVTAKQEESNGKSYTSGRINTKGKASWKYGRFDIKAKLPKGDFLWPALWMMPRDSVYGGWAASGEIDIMEARGQLNKQISSALHYGGSWPNNVYKDSGRINYDFDFSEDFHVFSCLWEEDKIEFSVDGKVFYSQNLDVNWSSGRGKSPYNANRQPFDQPFFFIINLAVGGGFFGSESGSLTKETAQKWASPQLVVDYVRVYQKINPTAPIPPPIVPVVPVASGTVSPSSKPTLPVQTRDAMCVNKCNGQSCCNDQKLGVVCYNKETYGCPVDLLNGKTSLCGGGLGVCGGVCFDVNRYDCTASGLTQKVEEIKSSEIEVELPSQEVPKVTVEITKEVEITSNKIEDVVFPSSNREQGNIIGQKNGGKTNVLSLFAIVLGLLLAL